MERKRETIEALGLPIREYNLLRKHIEFIDALVFEGEEGLRKIDGIGDASIAIIKKAMKKHGMDLPIEETRRVVLFEETSAANNNIKVSVCKWIPGPEEYTVLISEYAGRDMWIVRNMSCTPDGKPIILPHVFDSLDTAVQYAKELLKNDDKK